METLPSELVFNIFEHADHPSRLALRTVSKRTSDLVTPLVFDELHTTYFKCTLRNVEDIAASRIAKHIRKLVVYGNWIPSMSQEDWEKSIDFRPQERHYSQGERLYTFDEESREQRKAEWEALPRHHLSGEELDAGWSMYQRTIQEQARSQPTTQDCAVVNAIATLPRLKKVVSIAWEYDEDDKSLGGRADSWPLWRYLRRKIYVAPTYRPSYQRRALRGGEPESDASAALSVFRGVVERNGTSVVPPVTGLTLHIDAHDDFSLTGSLDTAPSGIIHSISKLTSLNVRWRTSSWLNFVTHNPPLRQELDMIIAAASNVRYLALSCENSIFHMRRTYLCLDTLGKDRSLRLPHLKKLSLSLDFPSRELIPFLKRHAGTIKSLKMRNMSVIDGPALVDFIPANLKLNHVYMERIYSNVHDGVLKRRKHRMMTEGTDIDHNHSMVRQQAEYLLGKGGTLPDVFGWPTPTYAIEENYQRQREQNYIETGRYYGAGLEYFQPRPGV